MSSPQKNKGSSWERDVAKFLSSQFNESFIRSPGSGAFVGGMNQHRKQYLDTSQIKNYKGDIVPGASFRNFNAECKNYGAFPFHQVVQGDCKQLETWLGQLMEVAEPEDVNILMIKVTRVGKFVAVEEKFDWDRTPTHIKYNSKKFNNWLIYNFDTFWQTNSIIFKNHATTLVENPNTKL